MPKGETMTNPQAVEVNCTTGEVTTRDLTPEEIAANELARQEYADMMTEAEAKAQAKADAILTAQTKLAALGLTTEEIAAITE